ncbi:hypothetical protein ACSBR2_005323 [Camellia fascicularis]
MEKNLLEGEQTRSPLLVHRANGREDSELQSNNDGESPATTIVVISTLIACCGSYVFGAAVGYSSPAESGIMDDLGLSDAAYSVFGSILTLGALLGAVMCGKMADLIGRRGTMAFSQIFCIIGWFAIAFAEGAWSLDLGRLSLGYGIGLLSYVVPVYIAEITPKNLRGGFTTVNQLFVTTGLSMTYLIGIVVHWRVLSLIGVVPCVLQLLGLNFMPESPRWLAMLGRWSQCKVALQRLRGQNANISEEAHEIRVPMTLLGVLLMDRSGRRPLLMISAAGTCLGSFLIGLSFLMQDDQAWEEITPILAVVGAVLFRGMFALGMGGIPWVMMSEIFPINMKVLGGSLVTAVNWFFTWVISYTFTFLMEWSSDGTFFMFAIMGALTILFVAKLVPETKGRTLEEIQASMN